MSASPKQNNTGTEMASSNNEPTNAKVDAAKENVHGIPEEMFDRMVRCTLEDGMAEAKVALLTLSKNFLGLWQNSSMSTQQDLVFPMKEVSNKTFKLVVNWLAAQILEQKQIDRSSIEMDDNGDRKPLTLNDFQRKFFDDLNFTSHAELLNAADFLDIPSLYVLGTMTMADRLKTMTEEEIRHNFDLEDDLSEEQKDEIRRLNVWCHY